MVAETPLTGGFDRRRRVVRVGDTVRRPASRSSAAVRAVLLHLERAGFDGAPRYLGTDELGREVLSFVDGQVPAPPYPAWSMTAEALTSLGALLRRFHDALASLDPVGTAPWQTVWADPAGGPGMCHNDVFPENAVFRDGRVVALIDFDLAAPGRPLWDLAIAIHEWAPLYAPGARPDHPPGLDAVARAGILARAYGLRRESVAELMDIIGTEREQAIANTRAEVAAGNPAWTPYWHQSGGEARTAANNAWFAQVRDALARSLTGRWTNGAAPGL